jgi:predicted RNA-binding protein
MIRAFETVRRIERSAYYARPGLLPSASKACPPTGERIIAHPDVVDALRRMARDYDDIVVDLEVGAIEIRHPELMPRLRRD